jgi:hypothetical protein
MKNITTETTEITEKKSSVISGFSVVKKPLGPDRD